MERQDLVNGTATHRNGQIWLTTWQLGKIILSSDPLWDLLCPGAYFFFSLEVRVFLLQLWCIALSFFLSRPPPSLSSD